MTFHLGAGALLAVLLQLAAIFAPLGSDDLRRVLFVVSYLLLFAFVVANLRHPGLVILGLGLCLNFLPIVANGGLMPITPETLARTGDPPEDTAIGDWVSGTKDVLKEREDVHIYLLSDRLVVDGQEIVRAFSIGDIIILIGALATVGEILLPRVGRSSG